MAKLIAWVAGIFLIVGAYLVWVDWYKTGQEATMRAEFDRAHPNWEADERAKRNRSERICGEEVTRRFGSAPRSQTTSTPDLVEWIVAPSAGERISISCRTDALGIAQFTLLPK